MTVCRGGGRRWGEERGRHRRPQGEERRKGWERREGEEREEVEKRKREAPFFGIGMKTDLFQSCGHC